MNDCYKQGFAAYNAGHHLWENPYYSWRDDDPSYYEWYDGYMDAEEEFLNEED